MKNQSLLLSIFSEMIGSFHDGIMITSSESIVYHNNKFSTIFEVMREIPENNNGAGNLNNAEDVKSPQKESNNEAALNTNFEFVSDQPKIDIEGIIAKRLKKTYTRGQSQL